MEDTLSLNRVPIYETKEFNKRLRLFLIKTYWSDGLVTEEWIKK
jgi:hypothetical protein